MQTMDRQNRICIVDDDPAVGELLRLVCESIGLPAHAFETAEDYLAACNRDCLGCEVLLLDVDLPGASGLELLRHLRSDGFSRPVLVVSGEGGEDVAERAFALGAVDFIAKPFNVGLVRARIRELVDGPASVSPHV